jgi:hypothetical protein
MSALVNISRGAEEQMKEMRTALANDDNRSCWTMHELEVRNDHHANLATLRFDSSSATRRRKPATNQQPPVGLCEKLSQEVLLSTPRHSTSRTYRPLVSNTSRLQQHARTLHSQAADFTWIATQLVIRNPSASRLRPQSICLN